MSSRIPNGHGVVTMITVEGGLFSIVLCYTRFLTEGEELQGANTETLYKTSIACAGGCYAWNHSCASTARICSVHSGVNDLDLPIFVQIRLVLLAKV